MPLRLSIALALMVAVLPARAEMYKWVDSKGQVNYSNTPPPSVAGKAQVVEEQISVIGMDPAVRAYAEQRFAIRARQDELDWQQRQRAIAVQQASSGYDSGYGGDYYPSSYYGGYYGGYYRRPIIGRPIGSLLPHVSHHTHHASRAAFHGSHTGGTSRR
jgi:hypothetical protein